MATKKAVTKKATTKRVIPSKHPKSPSHTLYGKPILEAVKSGNLAQMKQIRTVAQRHVKEIQSALQKLETKINKG